MTQLLVILPSMLICAVWGRFSKNFFTPSGVLLGTWALFLTAHLLIAPDYILSVSASSLILFFLLCFFCGEVAAYNFVRVDFSRARSLSEKNTFVRCPEFKNKLRRVIKIIGYLSLVGALIYFIIFANHFGSIQNLLLSGWFVRVEMAEGAISIPLPVRAIALLGYTGVLLAILYWTLYGMEKFVALPFLAILIMGIAQAARAGTFMLIIMVVIGSIWRDMYQGIKYIGKRFFKRLSYAFTLILVIFILGIMLREQNFTLDSDEFNQFKYFKIYAVGAISSFSVFIDSHNFDSELSWGKYSFASFFQLLGLHTFESFGYYDEYLNISSESNDFTNVYTIFRSSIEDFGIGGTILYLFILGFVSRVAYTNALNGGNAALVFIFGIYTMLIYSPIAPITQHNSIILSWFLSPLIVCLIKPKQYQISNVKS